MGSSQWCYSCLGTDSKKSGMCPEEAHSKERKPLSHVESGIRQCRDQFIFASEIQETNVYIFYSLKAIHEIIWKKVKKKVTLMTRNNSKHYCIISLADWILQVFVFQCMSYCLAGFLNHFVYSLLANVKMPRLPGKMALLETFHYQGLAVW